MKFSSNKKIFHLGIYIYLYLYRYMNKLFLIKLSARINDGTFLLDSISATVRVRTDFIAWDARASNSNSVPATILNN